MDKARTRIIGNIIKSLFAIFFIYYIFTLTDFNMLLAVLKNISIDYFILVIIFFVLEVPLASIRFWILIEKKVALTKILDLVIFQKSIASILSPVAGFAAYVTGMKADNELNIFLGISSFMFSKIGELLTIFMFLFISSIILWKQIAVVRLLVVLILFSGLIILLISIWAMNKRVAFIKFVEKLFIKFSLNKFSRLVELFDYLKSLSNINFKESFPIFLYVAGISVIIICFSISNSYFLNLAFNIKISIWAIIFMVSLQRLLSLFPIFVFGGLGVLDVTSLFLYGLFGFTQEEIAPIVLGSRILVYFLYSILLLLLPINRLISSQICKYK